MNFTAFSIYNLLRRSNFAGPQLLDFASGPPIPNLKLKYQDVLLNNILFKTVLCSV